MNKSIFIAAVMFCLAGFRAIASDYYVSQSGSGAINGADASDALPLSWLNNPTSWGGGSGTIQPGDTVHLVGTLTNNIKVGGSGTVSNYITVLFEPNASITQPAGSGISLQSYNNLVIDGGVNGLIQNTDNGSSLGSHKGVSGVCGNPSVGNITIQNLTLSNLYVRSTNTDESGGGSGISLTGNMTNIIIRNCTISQIQNGIYLGYAAGAASHDWNVYSNNISYVNWGVGVGDNNAGSSLYNVYIYNNVVDHWKNWDDVVGNSYHHNGIYTYAANSQSTISNCLVYANLIGPDFGTSMYQTSGIFASGASGSLTSLNRYMAFNNIIWVTNGGVAEGLINFSGMTNSLIANNTLYENNIPQAGVCIYAEYVTNTLIANNIVEGCMAVGIQEVEASWWKYPVQTDYNAYFPWGNNSGVTFSGWQGNSKDVHSINTTIAHTLTSSISGSFGTNMVYAACIGNGTNLSAWFTTDYAGNTRTNAGNWDIGAYGFNVTAGSGSGLSGGSLPGVTNSVPIIPPITNSVPAITNSVPVVTTTNTVPVTVASRPAAPGGLHAVW
jgi:hypothetical protein